MEKEAAGKRCMLLMVRDRLGVPTTVVAASGGLGATGAPEKKGLNLYGCVVAGEAHHGHRLLPSTSCRRPGRPGREVRVAGFPQLLRRAKSGCRGAQAGGASSAQPLLPLRCFAQVGVDHVVFGPDSFFLPNTVQGRPASRKTRTRRS